MVTGDTSPFEPEDVNGFARRVNQLGAATEQFFSRVYNVLNIRSEQKRQEELNRRLYRQHKELQAIVERREFELERLHGIIATITEGVILQDLDGRVVLINDAARDMLGEDNRFEETDLSSLFEAYRDIIQTDSELTPLGEPTRIQINNRIVGATLAAVANSEGERIGTLIVLRDVTVETLGDRLKDQFVTAISHELRTPMNSLKMAGEVLLSAEEDAPPNRRMLQMIGRNVDVLDRMIVELLDISEMTAGTFQIRQNAVDVEALAWNVVSGMMPEIKKARLDVSVMARDLDQLMLTGDEQRLRWAIGHLLQNSIRYTESGSVIIALSRSDVDRITVQVIDTGVGISEKDMPHIFERFYRGEPRTKAGRLLDPRGLGQGLFVARTVAEAHNGQQCCLHASPSNIKQ
ncbi:MAG: HAMP domain-containing sensor histidine kinase [Chloroflexota bacterium]